MLLLLGWLALLVMGGVAIICGGSTDATFKATLPLLGAANPETLCGVAATKRQADRETAADGDNDTTFIVCLFVHFAANLTVVFVV